MSDTLITVPAQTRTRIDLAWRVAIAGAVLVCEKLLLNFFVDFDASQTATGLGEYVRQAQHWGFRFLVTFAAALAVFGYVQGNARLQGISRGMRQMPLRRGWRCGWAPRGGSPRLRPCHDQRAPRSVGAGAAAVAAVVARKTQRGTKNSV